MKATSLLFGTLLALASLPAHAQLFPNLGGQRAGISALTPLKNDLSPRSTGLGGANATLTGDAYSSTTNPAQVAEVKSATFAVSDLYYAAGLMNHALAAVTVPIKNAGNLYVNVNMLNMSPEKVRTEFNPTGTGEYFSAYSMAANIGYARNLSDRFSIGLGVKYVRESMATYAANGLAADLGFLYRTDWRNLRFGAALQHFGPGSKLEGSYSPDLLQNGTQTTTENNPFPTLFKMGASMDLINKGDNLLTGHLQLNHPNDNAENIRIGAEYVWATMLSLRAGVKLGVDNERLPAFGIGYRHSLGGNQIMIDYGVNPTVNTGLWHSLGLSFTLGRPAEPPTPPTEQPAPATTTP